MIKRKNGNECKLNLHINYCREAIFDSLKLWFLSELSSINRKLFWIEGLFE